MNNSSSLLFASQLRYQNTIFENATANIRPEELLLQPSDNANPILWLLGHIVNSRYMLASVIGMDISDPNGKLFADGYTNTVYPTVSEIKSSFETITGLLIDKLETIDNEHLNLVNEKNSSSLSDYVSFFIYHEAYHLGQIGYARKSLGLTIMKSY